MKSISNLLFFVLLLAITPSHAQKIISAYIYDNETKTPIENVQILKKSLLTATTNKLGFFTTSFEIPKDTFLLLSKVGYRSISLHLPTKAKTLGKTDTIYMYKSECDVMELESSDIEELKESKSKSRIESDGMFAPASEGIRMETRTSDSYKMSMPEPGIKVPVQNLPTPKAGMLTGGEVNDFTKWNLWEDLTNQEFNNWKNTWKLSAENRFTAQLISHEGKAISGAIVSLVQNDKVIWNAVSDNTGKAELWHNGFLNDEEKKSNFQIHVNYNGQEFIKKRVKPFEKKINIIEINAACERITAIDLAFVVDATGSMGDEIKYLKTELYDIIERAKDTLPYINFNIASVFYRDKGDEYLTKHQDFSADPKETINFIKANFAGGGGDRPEAVDEALDVCLNQLAWREKSLKMMFLLLDAPPHQTEEYLLRIQKLVAKAAEKGVRIIPVACSGIDKSTEFFLRSLALFSNGTYTFLTDHSGIGNPHIEPSTDEYQVEYLNDLIVRIIYQMGMMPDCDIPLEDSTLQDTAYVQKEQKPITTDSTDSTEKPKPTIIKWQYYPNPSSGLVFIETEAVEGELYLSDLSGKILQRHPIRRNNQLKINISNYPDGIYLIRYQYDKDKWLSGKVLLKH